jgi:hypothetical protein
MTRDDTETLGALLRDTWNAHKRLIRRGDFRGLAKIYLAAALGLALEHRRTARIANRIVRGLGIPLEQASRSRRNDTK